jgi:KaiC/GvpD/RAD55 family RecA-like ATPase
VTEKARALLALGWNLVPIRDGTKAPIIPWQSYKTETCSQPLLLEKLTEPKTAFGVITGLTSGGLAILDFDEPEAYGRWSRANADQASRLPTATTGRGHHVFIRLEDGQAGRIILEAEEEPCGDLLNAGKLAILPPARHPSGRLRTWVREPVEAPPVCTLEELGLRLQPHRGPALAAAGLEIPEGQRHQALTSLAGRLRNSWLTSEELEAALLALNSSRCRPPLPEDEVLRIAQWAGSLEVHPSKPRENDEESQRIYHHDSGPKEEEESRLVGSVFLSLPDYLRQTGASEVEWLLEGFLPRGYLVILGGTSKAGKSCFLTALGLHLAEGRDFLGLEAAQTPVLWCALEESEGERRIALEAYDGEPEAFYTGHAKVYIDSKEGIGLLRQAIRETGAGLLVIDPLYAANRAESLTDGAAARRVLQPLKDLCREERVTAILVHHLNKNTGAGAVRERFADSNQLLASASMDWLMDSDELNDGTREIVLRSRGRGEFANQTWVIRSGQLGEYQLLRSGRDADRGQEATDARILEALEGRTATAAELADQSGLNLGTVRNRLTELKRDGRILEADKDGKALRYRAA